MVTIYTLSTNVNEIFYVGATRKTLKERFYGHGCLLKSMNLKKADVKIEEIETCNNSIARYVELYWINQFKSWGFNLKNKAIHSFSYRTLSDSPIKYPNGISPLDEYQDKISVLNKEVQLRDLDKLTRYSKLGRPVLCCKGTYFRYANKKGYNDCLAKHIFHELSKILKARGVDVDSILKELNS